MAISLPYIPPDWERAPVEGIGASFLLRKALPLLRETVGLRYAVDLHSGQRHPCAAGKSSSAGRWCVMPKWTMREEGLYCSDIQHTELKSNGDPRHKFRLEMSAHRFGGAWTDKKLKALSDYLTQYRLIFTTNEKAKYFKTIYLDGFAGTGARQDTATKASDDQQLSLSPEMDVEVQEYKRGSAAVALGLSSPFDRYVFVEKQWKRAEELALLIHEEYAALEPRCKVFHGEANDFLRDWCATTDWRAHRAVVFLDPYGMNVYWDTISSVAATKAIDMWLLFPLGTGINRLLTRDAPPPTDWAEKVTRILGVPRDVWEPAFYVRNPQTSLFGSGDEVTIKVADFKSMGDFFIERLGTVFAGVAPHAMPLFNSRNNPMYLLCFAAGNVKGAKPAVKIADHLLKGG